MTISQPLSSTSFVLVLPPSEQLGVSDSEGRSTAVAFLSYVSESSLADARLHDVERTLLHMRPVPENKEESLAMVVGMRYGAVRRDSVLNRLSQAVASDPDVARFIASCVESCHAEEASNRTLEMFSTVVQSVLEVDKRGIGEFCARVFMCGYFHDHARVNCSPYIVPLSLSTLNV